MPKILKKELIYERLREEIVSGKLAPGSKLPGGLELARRYGVAHLTIRSALRRLAEEEFVAFRNGSGTFVTNRGERPLYLIITGDLSDISMPANYVIPGIERTMGLAGYRTKHCLRDFLVNGNKDELLERFAAAKVQGYFLLESNFTGNESELALLKQVDAPVVMPLGLEVDRQHCSFAMIRGNHKNAFLDAVKHLHGLGHRRICTIAKSGFPCTMRGMDEDEYLGTLGKMGIASSPDYLRYCDHTAEDIDKAVSQLLELKPTALMCFSDFFAIHALASLRRRGLRVPEDISLMGFCGYPGSEFLTPSLSTVDLCYDELGCMSAGLMLRSRDWLGGETPVLDAPYRLIVRNSTQKL